MGWDGSGWDGADDDDNLFLFLFLFLFFFFCFFGSPFGAFLSFLFRFEFTAAARIPRRSHRRR